MKETASKRLPPMPTASLTKPRVRPSKLALSAKAKAALEVMRAIERSRGGALPPTASKPVGPDLGTKPVTVGGAQQALKAATRRFASSRPSTPQCATPMATDGDEQGAMERTHASCIARISLRAQAANRRSRVLASQRRKDDAMQKDGGHAMAHSFRMPRQIAGAGVVKKRAPKEPVLDRVALRAGTMLPTSATHRRMLRNLAHLFAIGNTEIML